MNPDALSPEEWERKAVIWEAQAIVYQPDAKGDQQRRRAIWAEIRAVHGDRPPLSAYMEHASEFRAIKERHWAAEGARLRARIYRDCAALAGILRATEEADR